MELSTFKLDDYATAQEALKDGALHTVSFIRERVMLETLNNGFDDDFNSDVMDRMNETMDAINAYDKATSDFGVGWVILHEGIPLYEKDTAVNSSIWRNFHHTNLLNSK